MDPQSFIPNENARKWADALTSGTYRQTTGALEDNRGFCCLGVACVVAAENGVDVERDYDMELGVTYNGHTGSLPDVVRDWLGLALSNGGYDTGRSLADDNDHRRHSFAHIALTIRSTPSLYAETTHAD